MASALAKALGQLFDPRILGILGACVLLSLACFVAAWYGVDWLLDTYLRAQVLARLLDVVGGLLTLLLAWFLFPLVASSFVALFLERIATVVEARHYPQLPKAPGLPWAQALGSSARFLVFVLLANLLLLVLLLFPIAYPIGYFLVNGWLLGREYFELVALRRLSPQASRTLRQQHAFELLLGGMAITALLTLPFVNLVIPVLATATMVHRLEEWRRAGP